MIVFALPLAACGDDGGDNMGNPDATQTGCQVTPGTWDAPDFDTNAADTLALRSQLSDLMALMRGAEQETMTVDEVSDLTALYADTGDPSLEDATTTAYDAIMDDAFADFVALALAGPGDLIAENGDWDPGDDGGIQETRGINAGGLEVRQLVDKGLFSGGAFYAYALTLTEGTIDEATIDAIAAAFGTNATLDTGTADDSAGYAFDMGYHGEAVGHLTDARAYAADSECTAERDAALVAFFRAWEEGVVARAIFYGNAGAGEVAGASDDAGIISGLHELAEGIGLVLGFYGLPDPSSGPLAGDARVMTDTDIEAVMSALNVDINDLSASTTGDFVDSTTFNAAVTDMEAAFVSAFGFSTADLESFRDPTEG